tara:strand:+ start:1130 stop:1513 length:384 start_codon:yes stop_codon:yes gene_type:complete
MKFTALQLNMINHRLEAPDAMAEVLAEELVTDYETAIGLVDRYAPKLIMMLEKNLAFGLITGSLLDDLKTDTCYLSCAESSIGDNWPDSKTGTPMTPFRFSRFMASHDSMVDKMNKAIRYPRTGEAS